MTWNTSSSVTSRPASSARPSTSATASSSASTTSGVSPSGSGDVDAGLGQHALVLQLVELGHDEQRTSS